MVRIKNYICPFDMVAAFVEIAGFISLIDLPVGFGGYPDIVNFFKANVAKQTPCLVSRPPNSGWIERRKGERRKAITGKVSRWYSS